MVSRNASLVVRVSAALALPAFALALAACSSGDGSSGTGGAATTQTGNPYDTADKINNYLNGKKLTMSGTDIPPDPNGYNENVNYGQATQCYSSVVMTPAAAGWHVASTLGTLDNAPNKGDMGMCDTSKPGQMVGFDATTILIANVGETCFDFTATFVGFSQEGRGSLSTDGRTLELELFFGGQAAGHRCADGAVGAKTVTLMGTAFSGNAVQTYQVQ
jgi:hypothetical protein